MPNFSFSRGCQATSRHTHNIRNNSNLTACDSFVCSFATFSNIVVGRVGPVIMVEKKKKGKEERENVVCHMRVLLIKPLLMRYNHEFIIIIIKECT